MNLQATQVLLWMIHRTYYRRDNDLRCGESSILQKFMPHYISSQRDNPQEIGGLSEAS